MRVSFITDIKLNVVLIEYAEMWSAQCLQYDIGAQGNTLEEVVYQLNRTLTGYISICQNEDVAPFSNLGRAPQQYWDEYDL